jgi:hypothetical protein
MQMNGSAKLSAPRCTAVTISLGNTTGTGAALFGTGDTVLTSAALAGANTVSVTLTATNLGAFNSAVTAIVGYGTTNEETVVLKSATNTTITLKDNTVLAKDHAANERILVKPVRSIRPGSVSILENSVSRGTDAAADGVLTGSGLTGTVDYSTGHIYVNWTQTAGSLAMTATADAMTDAPDATDGVANGAGAHKQFNANYLAKTDVPDTVIVSNLGDGDVGYFFEVSRNGGKSFTTKGTSASAELTQFSNKTTRVPGGVNQVVRFRAGSQSASTNSETSPTSTTDSQGRIIEPRVVTVDTSTNLNHG